MMFPEVVGYNLLRERKTLPVDFAGKINLVFVPFYQWHQMVVDTWVPFAKDLAQVMSGFDFYELPTIRKMNLLSQTFINEGMRMGIPNPATRQRTITLYIDKQAFRAALGIQDENDVYVYLVSRDGAILWQSQGEFSPEKGNELVQVIKEQVLPKLQADGSAAQKG